MMIIKRICICLIVLLLCSFNSYDTHAENIPTSPYNPNYKYINGVGNITAWLDYSSGVGVWEFLITPSVNNWMYTGWANPIYITFVSSNYGSNLDFHSHNNSWFINNGYGSSLAITLHYTINDVNLNTNYDESPSGSWYYAEIHINDDYFSEDFFTNTEAGGTIRHEMGHAFGLQHNNENPYSIMHNYVYQDPFTGQSVYRAVQTVQYTDNLAINNLYSYGN